jgi:hypothetical protein
MGFLDFLKPKKEAETAPKAVAAGEACSYCNKPGANRTFGGMPWHKKCLRAARRQAKGMI